MLDLILVLIVPNASRLLDAASNAEDFSKEQSEVEIVASAYDNLFPLAMDPSNMHVTRVQ